MAGTNHELAFDIITSGTSDISSGGRATPRAGTVTLKIFEQPWTNTLSVTSARLSYSVSPISFAITTTDLAIPDGGLALDARTFATLDAQAVAEEAACEDHSATVRCAYSATSWCSTNGNTYSSRCMARAACQFDATRDACPSRELPFAQSAREPPLEPLHAPSPPQPAACVPNPMRPCPYNWAPICGEDGVTYANSCAVRRRPPPCHLA